MVKAEQQAGGRKTQLQLTQMQQVGNFPRDLLKTLVSDKNFTGKSKEESEETEEIELSLGLSSNGRFGVDPKAEKMSRYSSILQVFTIAPNEQEQEEGKEQEKENKNCLDSSAIQKPVVRTYLIPAEKEGEEEEVRKRKEMQSLRRMAAKRKRTEKQRNRNRPFAEENNNEKGSNGLNEFSAMQIVPGRVPGAKGACDGFEFNGQFGNGSGSGSILGNCSEGLGPHPPSSLEGSVGSQGAESAMSESDSQQHQPPIQAGKNSPVESKSTASRQSLPESDEKVPVNRPGTVVLCNNGRGRGENGVKEIARNVLEDMPCVSVKGDGANGKRVEGFLYRYKKGEEVRIVCVCHGSFLTPAEFVKHAGYGDVEHPLKHIVVNPNPL